MANLMRVLSLCTGIGGIDLACEATGAMVIVGQVELDEFCNRVLAHHWPYVQRARDLYEVTGDEWGAIDLVVAGFPCQPVSGAGKRRGADDARWLWPEVARIIRACQPAFVLLENVPGLISLGLDDVLGDLDSAGYESAACVYPAAAVGAPHERERVFIVGHLANAQCGEGEQRHDASGVGRRALPTKQAGVGGDSDSEGDELAHPNSDRCGDGAHQQIALARSGGTAYAGIDGAKPVVDSNGTGRRARRTTRQSGQAESGMGRDAHGLPGRMAGHPILSHRWPARPGEAQYEWEAPRTVPASDKTPHRAAKLKALGNAVVPQQVYPILAAIAETWRQMQEVA